jgi:WD40 repeat protein
VRSIDDPTDACQFTGHTAATTVARFSPSGFKVASGDVSGMVRVWEPATPETTRGEYAMFSGRVNDIAWDGDSQRIVAVGDGRDRFGRAITADSGNSVGEIIGHAKAINAVALRQSRPIRAATVGDDGAVCFLHGVPFAFKTKDSARHGNGFVYGAAYSPDGSVFVTVGADKRINVFDGKEGTHLREIAGAHAGSIMAVAFSQKGDRFVTASADQTVKLWDLEASRAVQTWRFGGGDDGGAVVSVADQQHGVAYPHGRTDGLVVSLSLSGDLNYLYEGSDAPARVVQGHNKSITAFGGGGGALSSPKTLWTGSFDGRVCQWDMGAGTAAAVEGASHSNQVVGFAASASGAKTYSVGWDDTLRAVDASSVTFLGDAPKVPAQPCGVAEAGNERVYVATAEGVAVYSVVAVGGSGNAVKVYDVSSKEVTSLKEVASLEASKGPVSTLAFSPDGTHLAAGNSLGKIHVYSTSGEWKVVADRWSAHTARVTSIAWHPAGKHAASGALDTHIHVWCLDPAKQGKRTRADNAHVNGVTGVRWVGDDTVASAGGDAAVKLWKVASLP